MTPEVNKILHDVLKSSSGTLSGLSSQQAPVHEATELLYTEFVSDVRTMEQHVKVPQLTKASIENGLASNSPQTIISNTNELNDLDIPSSLQKKRPSSKCWLCQVYH